MQTKYAMGSTSVQIFKLNEDTILDKLPARVYSVNFHPLMGFSLNILKKSLDLPNKIYGKVQQRTEKCIETYKSRTASTGILLTGDKGTGKTLQMAYLANKVISELNLPVIMITEPHAGAQFTSFIESIGECCLIFDEFGKMYRASRASQEADIEAPQQSSLLSLMDGVDKTKRMIILTENSEYDINDFMLNRPSRIYYHFKYKKLEEESIIGYCKDINIKETIINDILDISRKSKLFSFDMLQSITEEHLRFGSSVQDSISDLNIDVSEDTLDLKQVVKIIYKQTNTEMKLHKQSIFSGIEDYGVSIRIKDDNPDNKNKSKNITVEPENLAYRKGDQSVYDTEEYTVIFKDLAPRQQNFSLLI